MIGTLPLVLLASFSPLEPAPAAPPPIVEDDEEVPDKREEIEELIDRLKDHLKQRGDEDREVIAVVDELTREFPRSGPKDKDDIVDALERVLKTKRRETDEGLPDNRIHVAAATALGTMGPESAKTLEKWIDKKPHEQDLVVQRALILSLGETAEEKTVDTLIDLLRHDRPEIQAATAEALSNFEEAELELRKDIFKSCLDVLMAVRSIIDQDQTEIIERKRWDIISGPIMSTLQTLSGHREQDAHRWQRWWNKNKKEDWDEDVEG